VVFYIGGGKKGIKKGESLFGAEIEFSMHLGVRAAERKKKMDDLSAKNRCKGRDVSNQEVAFREGRRELRECWGKRISK